MGNPAWEKARAKIKAAKVRSEASIQTSVTKFAKRAKQKHWRAVKRSHGDMFGTNGEPDYEFIHKTCAAKAKKLGRPHIFLIEFKKPGMEPTDHQEEKIKELRACGVRVYVCDNADEGKKIVRKEETLC